MPGQRVAAQFHESGQDRLLSQNGHVRHWLGRTEYTAHPRQSFFSPVRKMQSLVFLSSLMLWRKPYRFRCFCLAASTVMPKCSAKNSISGLVIQIYPSSGPAQQLPQPVHSKFNPHEYQWLFVNFNSLYIPNQITEDPKNKYRSQKNYSAFCYFG